MGGEAIDSEPRRTARRKRAGRGAQIRFGQGPPHCPVALLQLMRRDGCLHDRARQGDDLCLKTAAQAGVCGLKVFEYVFPERYALLGLTDQIRNLQGEL